MFYFLILKIMNNTDNKNPVVHFEMPYEDENRISNFYEQAFGWKMIKLWEDMGNYITAHTSETDENNMVKTPWTINWWFYPKNNDMPAQYPSVVISVEDIKNAMIDIKSAWWKVLGEPIDIPWVWLYVSFFDTEGNRSSILQATYM